MLLFRFLLVVDAIAAAIIVYFFFVGIADGSVSDFNMALWTTILTAVIAILAGGWFVNASGRRGAAIAVLAILAIPSLVFGLFVLSLVVFQPHWN